MDADDAKKWKQQTEEHKDDFKTAAAEKDDFYTAYDQLADQSKVDAPGGSEYSRVRRDWLSRPDHERMSAADLKAFIVWRANLQLGDLKSDPKGKIPKTANDGAWKVDAGFRKTPVGWTEKEGRKFFSQAKQASTQDVWKA
jgi:hypothetical protein